MTDSKSKLPDFKEVTSIASKLFKDLKTSVAEIIIEYKKKRADDSPAPTAKAKKASTETVAEKEDLEKTAKTPKPKKTEDSKADKD